MIRAIKATSDSLNRRLWPGTNLDIAQVSSRCFVEGENGFCYQCFMLELSRRTMKQPPGLF